MSRLDANIRGVELFRQANRLTMFTLVCAAFPTTGTSLIERKSGSVKRDDFLCKSSSGCNNFLGHTTPTDDK